MRAWIAVIAIWGNIGLFLLPAWGEKTPKVPRVEVPKSKTLNPAKKPLTVEAWVKPAKGDGVVVARGGWIFGFSLYLLEGRPHFSIRANKKIFTASAKERVALNEWVHLAGMLTAERKLLILVNGKVAGSAEVPSFIPANPAEPMQIGADRETTVAKYKSPFPFQGLIDEVRLYFGPMTPEEVAQHYQSPGPAKAKRAKLVLYYSFDKGKAEDESGCANHGKVMGAEIVDGGKFGKALKLGEWKRM